jgi:hypothetical protein
MGLPWHFTGVSKNSRPAVELTFEQKSSLVHFLVPGFGHGDSTLGRG